MHGMNIEMEWICNILWIILCVYIGRYNAYVLDKQYSDPGGKPIYITIPNNWRWAFRFQESSYNNKIWRVSFFFALLGYLFGIIERVLLLCAIKSELKDRIFDISYEVFCWYIFLSLMVMIIGTFGYEYNMRIAYDYDWVTYFQEGIFQKSKRRCKVINQIDEETYEIILGRFGKRIYRAEAEGPMEIGDKKYAIHFYHSLEKNTPYWIIKNY